MSEILENRGAKVLPQPVRAAQAVLAELQNREDYAALSKILPGFAMALHKSGTEVTEDGLKACAEKGAVELSEEMQRLKSAASPQSAPKNKTYEDVLEILNATDALSLEQAVSNRDTEEVQHLKEGFKKAEDLFRAIRMACDNGYYKELAILTGGFVLSLVENTDHYDFRASYYPGHAHAALIRALSESGTKQARENIKPLTDDLLALVRCPSENRLGEYEESFTSILQDVCGDKLLKTHGKALIAGAAKNGYMSAVRYLAGQDKNLANVLTEADTFCDIAEAGHVEVLKFLDQSGLSYPLSKARADFMAPIYNAVANGKTTFLNYCRRHHPERIEEKHLASGFYSAASNGHREILDYIIKHYPDAITQEVLDESLEAADENGEFPIWCFLTEKGAKPHYASSHLLCGAAEKGDLDRIKTLHKNGLNLDMERGEALVQAAKHGQFAVAEYLLDNGVSARSQGTNTTNEIGEALAEACKYGHYDVAKLLLERGADPNDQFGNAMMGACFGGYTDIIKLLVDYGSPHFVQGWENVTLAVGRPNGLKTIRFMKEEMEVDLPLSSVMKHIEMYEGYGILAYYQEIGEFKIEDAPEEKREKLQTGLENFRQWHRSFGADVPKGLYGYSPKGLKKDTFKLAQEILKKEGYEGETANTYAYAAAYLFGTQDRMLAYLEKWGEAGKQPFHNVVHKIRLPKMGEKQRRMQEIVGQLRVLLGEEDEERGGDRPISLAILATAHLTGKHGAMPFCNRGRKWPGCWLFPERCRDRNAATTAVHILCRKRGRRPPNISIPGEVIFQSWPVCV